MNYKELQNQLKTFKEQGLTTIALNAKKDILEAEYDRVMNAMIKDALNTEPETIEDLVTEDLGKEVSAIEVINEAVTIANDTEDLIKEVSALASVDLVNEIVANPPLELIEDCSLNSLPPESKINQVIETIEAIPPEIKEAPIALIPLEIIGVSIDGYTVKSNDNEEFSDLKSINLSKAQISQVSIAKSTLSNSESMARINEAVINPPVLIEPKDTEVTSKEFIEALSKLVIFFLKAVVNFILQSSLTKSIVKLWVKVNRISQLVSSIKEARADIKTFMQWYFSGFKFPEFV